MILEKQIVLKEMYYSFAEIKLELKPPGKDNAQDYHKIMSVICHRYIALFCFILFPLAIVSQTYSLEKYSSAVNMRNYLFLYIVAMTTLITLKAVIIVVSGSYFGLVVSGLILYNMRSHIL